MQKKNVSLLLISGLLLLGVGTSVSNAETPTAGAASGHVGAETCKGCHEALYESYAKNMHSKKNIPGAPGSGKECESCHGAGAGHVEKGGGRGTGMGNFGKNEEAKDKAARCLACHGESERLALWESSKHNSEGISCDSCHSGHSNLPKSLKKPQSELCVTCHRDIGSQINKQSHHPIKEGKVTCSDCHDPHGSLNPKNLKADSVNELCYKCHAEKRGPFLHEHPPVAEDCLTCHVAHGSNHNKLLNQKTPMLCQSCHIGTSGHFGAPFTAAKGFGANTPASPTNYTSVRAIGRACLNCHAAIHGSNGPGRYGKQFAK